MALCAQVCLCLCVSRTLASLACVQTVLLFGNPGVTSITPGGSRHLVGIACSSPEAPQARPLSLPLSSFLLLFHFCCLRPLCLLPLQLCSFGEEVAESASTESISTHLFPPPDSARVNTVQLGAILWPPMGKLTSFWASCSCQISFTSDLDWEVSP